MCKLLFFSSIKHLNFSENDSRFLKICEIMEQGQKDGIGYFSDTGMVKAASLKDITNSCGIFDFTERKPIIRGGGCPFNSPHSIVIHSRTSTNAYGPEAAHPFEIDGNFQFFAHNGVVSVPEKHDFPVKTRNDSEYLGYLYHRGGQEALKTVQGYFAFMTYENNGFTIIRDNRATLFASRMSGEYRTLNKKMNLVESHEFSIDVITTVEKDLPAIAKVLGLEFSTPEKVKAFSAIRYKNGKFEGYETLSLGAQKLVKDEAYHKSIGKLGQTGYDGYDDDSLTGASYKPTSACDLFDLGYTHGFHDAQGNNEPSPMYEDADYQDGYQEGYADSFEKITNKRL